MINLSLTVREALWILSKCEVYDSTYDKIVAAFEKSVGVDNRCSVTITRGITVDNRISCIKAIRLATGLGLRDAKEWSDVVMGHYGPAGQFIPGTANTIKMGSADRAEFLLRELAALGCEGYLS